MEKRERRLLRGQASCNRQRAKKRDEKEIREGMGGVEWSGVRIG